MSHSTERLAHRLSPLVAVLHEDESTRNALVDDLINLAESYRERLSSRGERHISEKTSYLITYPDSFQREGQPPLQTLDDIARSVLTDYISDIHLLPMFPWTSDDGFGVVDHREINPAVGTWEDVHQLSTHSGLMFDFVANHISASSPWFTGWLAGDPRYEGYFISPGDDFDVRHVVRPRTSPLVHTYARPDGTEATAWTTFGPDQVDVNVATPRVLLDLTDILLAYVEHGADAVRLDAIGYLWKASGTSCTHLPGTHAIIKIWSALLDDLAPGVQLLTETNVPHADNITYFGDGDEADMVYQFPLPPLVLHTFLTGDAGVLSSWAANLEDLRPGTTWFNFLASHDGIGLRPALGLLTAEQIGALIDRSLAHGGRVSYSSEPDGSSSPYELNTSYLNALIDPAEAQNVDLVVSRAVAAHAILLSMIGVPAIYVHSLFGSDHDVRAVEETGINRRINRQVLNADDLLNELEDSPRRRGIFEALTRMLRVRRQTPAFDPASPQQILDLGREVFAIRRGVGRDAVIAIVNVSGSPVNITGVGGIDLLGGATYDSAVSLDRDGVVWLLQSAS